MRLRWVALVAILLTPVGCGSSDDDPPRADAGDPSETVSTSPSPTEESSGPPPSSGPVHALGDRVRLATGSLMTVYSWQRAQRPGKAAHGEWRAADVKFCLTETFGSFKEPATNILSQLRAELTDGRALDPDKDARTPDEVFAQPHQMVVAGKCLRGDVVFDVPTGQAGKYLAATVSEFGWVRWRLA